MILNRKSEEKVSELLQIIENLKTKLMKSGITKGLNDPQTLQISEQLDIYIIRYQKLVSKKSNY
ncbi:MAG: aspartyl-phosphate phosphatase Spo0E family protein [Bacillus sp. (in: firmicutes)]